MSVAAVVVTRGDHDEGVLQIAAGLPDDWDFLRWDNGLETVFRWAPNDTFTMAPVSDFSVYGRYAAIEHTDAGLIYVQDDDCIVSDPQALVDAWLLRERTMGTADHVVCNMPPQFRHEFYEEHALVGFGACFQRGAPERAFQRFTHRAVINGDRLDSFEEYGKFSGHFRRTCDIVFTGLTPRVLVDVPKTDLPWASASNRMWQQKEHVAERTRMLALVRQVRDA